MASNLSSDCYGRFLDDLREWIQSAQLRAATAVNRELVTLYWRIGCAILAKQQQEGWGAKVIDRTKELYQEYKQRQKDARVAKGKDDKTKKRKKR